MECLGTDLCGQRSSSSLQIQLFRESPVEHLNVGKAGREFSFKPRVATRSHPGFLEEM